MTKANTITVINTITQQKIKAISVPAKIIERCAVQSAYATDLTFEELQALVNWCNCQSSDLWEDMSLQEILNVYRATSEWCTFEAWAAEDWKAAYAAWNAAVIDEGNQMTPRC